MKSSRHNLLMLRSEAPVQLVGFSELLGLCFHQEQHGNGPAHRNAEVDGVIMEVYPAQALGEVDESRWLGFDIDAVGSVIGSLREQSVEVVSDLKQTQWGQRAVVRDPDGRLVELAGAT